MNQLHEFFVEATVELLNDKYLIDIKSYQKLYATTAAAMLAILAAILIKLCTCIEILKIVTLYWPIDLRRRMSWMGSQEMANIMVTLVTRVTTLFLFFMLSLLT